MENLTLAQKIIKPHTIDPLEGHTVVVLERIGTAGEEFRFEIEPGQRVPKTRLDLFKWLRGRTDQEKYFAYAVTGDPELRLNITTPVKMEDHVHTLMLLIAVSYSVTEPRTVVTTRNHDPIRKLREEIARVLQRDTAWRSWISIRSEFRDVAREMVGANREALDRFATRYGLQIHAIDVACKLDDGDVLDLKTEATVEVQTAVHTVTADFERLKLTEEAKTAALRNQQAHEETVRNHTREHELQAQDDLQTFQRGRLHAAVEGQRRAQQLYEAATNAGMIAVGNVAQSIRTPAELLDTFQSLNASVAQSRLMLEEPGDGHAASAGQPRLTASGGQSGAAAVIMEMFAQTERAACDLVLKRQLQSAILHLVAEAMMNGNGDPQLEARYSERIADLRAESGVPVELFDYLKRFVDPERLKASLC